MRITPVLRRAASNVGMIVRRKCSNGVLSRKKNDSFVVIASATEAMRPASRPVLRIRTNSARVSKPALRARDMCNVVLGRAEYHFRSLAAGKAAQHAQEIIAVHFRHVPIKQNRVGKFALTSLGGLLAVRGFENLKLEIFQNSSRDFADNTGVI